MNTPSHYTLEELEKQKYDLMYTPLPIKSGQVFADFQKTMDDRKAKIAALDAEIARLKSYLPATIEEVVHNIIDTLMFPMKNAFNQAINNHPDKPDEQKIALDIVSKQGKIIYDNLVLIHNSGIALNTISDFDIKNFLQQVIYSKHIAKAFTVMDRLNIPKNVCYLARIDHAFSFGSHNKAEDALFFHKDLFEECITHFGEEELRNIFIYDGVPPAFDNWVIKNPVSGKSIHDRMEEGKKIAEFCMHTGFDSGMAGVRGFLSVGTFMTPIGDPNRHNETVHYLGSYASELRYFIEKLHVPFDDLFALPKADLALYCGILRSLANCTWKKHGKHEHMIDFSVGNTPSPLDPADVFSTNTLIYYFHDYYSSPKLTQLVQFLQPYVQKDIRIQLPSADMLAVGNVQKAITNYVHFKRLLHYVPTIDTIDWEEYLHGNKPIPAFLLDDTLRTFVDRCNKLYSMTSKNSLETYISRQIDLRSLPWDDILNYAQEMPYYIRDDKQYEKICGMIENYNLLLRHITDKNRFIITNREQYFEHPDHLAAILKNMKEAAGDISKNMRTVVALAQTLQAEGKGTPLLLSSSGHAIRTDQKFSSKAFAKQYFKILKQLDRKYAGLYSIGGKIHTEQSIDDGLVDDFVSSTGLNQTCFKLIHANTSVLLPPSYFPEELMFMIQAMGQYGLFENHDKPQLQISIPGRLKDQYKAGILASSMILLSQTHVEYSPESFDTTHNSQTGRRMVSYDAGVYDPSFKYNSDGITGRTDVLLLRDINLIPKAKVIGSLLAQTEYDGWFAELGTEFIRDYMELMRKYHLDGMIMHRPWVFQKEDDRWYGHDIMPHYQAVKAFTDRQATDWLVYNHTKQNQGLLVFELDKLLQTYRKKIESIQSRFR